MPIVVNKYSIVPDESEPLPVSANLGETNQTGNEWDTLARFAVMLDVMDKYTFGHSQRVSNLATAIAGELGLDTVIQEQVRVAGFVHDIGKIIINKEVLNKDGVLSVEEYRHIVSHSIAGERIVRSFSEDRAIPLLVRHHHERYDGLGYPDRLKGDQIPIGAQILAVADTYDALTSDRPYRKALSNRAAIEELKRQRGRQFDPGIVDALLRIYTDTEGVLNNLIAQN